MEILAVGTDFYRALKSEGFDLPDECGDVHMTVPVDGPIQLHYTVNVREEDLVKIGRALEKMGEHAK
jgi:hypothetical protein